MKNITLSADVGLIDRARQRAQAQHRTLNDAFRDWLAQFAAGSGEGQSYDALMRQLAHVKAGRRFNREEANERR